MIDADLFRRAAGSFASGVTVVTVEDDAGNLTGATVSAFSSLSLDPTLVLVCLDSRSGTLSVLRAVRRFGVNILSKEQEHLSRLFASKQRDAASIEAIERRRGRNGSAIFHGAVAYLECSVADLYEAGDHVIVIAEVTEAGVEPEADPLSYFRGSYRSLQGVSTEG